MNINNSFSYNNISKRVNETPKITISEKPFSISFFSNLISRQLKEYLKTFQFIKKQVKKYNKTQYYYKPPPEEEYFLFKILKNDILSFKKEYPYIVNQWEKTSLFLNQK